MARPGQAEGPLRLILAAGTLLVTLGYASEVTVQNWVEVIMQVVGVLGLLLASYNAKRLDYTGIYLAAAGLVTGLTGEGPEPEPTPTPSPTATPAPSPTVAPSTPVRDTDNALIATGQGVKAIAKYLKEL